MKSAILLLLAATTASATPAAHGAHDGHCREAGQAAAFPTEGTARAFFVQPRSFI